MNECWQNETSRVYNGSLPTDLPAQVEAAITEVCGPKEVVRSGYFQGGLVALGGGAPAVAFVVGLSGTQFTSVCGLTAIILVYEALRYLWGEACQPLLLSWVCLVLSLLALYIQAAGSLRPHTLAAWGGGCHGC